MDTIINFTRKNTWAVIFSAIIFSFIFPKFGIFLKPYLNYLLGTLMFLSCLDLKVNEILKSFSDIKAQFITLLIVNFVSPTIIYLLRDYFSPEIFLGLIIASVIPAGRSAVFLSHIYGGIPVKALVVTSLSNVISPITVPLLVWFYAHTTIKVDPLSMGMTIFWMVLIPLIFAFFFGKTKPGVKLNVISPTISTFIVFLIIMGIISPIKDVIIANPNLTIILLIIISILIIIDFGLGFLIKKDLPGKITYGLSSGYKNYTMATILAISLFNPIVALPSIVYTIANNLLLIPLQLLLTHPTTPKHHHHKFKNIFFLLAGITVTLFLSFNPEFKNLVASFGKYGYISAFFAGVLFTSTFTVGIGGLILITLSHFLNPFLIVIIGALGGVLADFFVFRFIRTSVSSEVTSVFDKINHRSRLYKLLHTPYFSWTLSILGILIMATPLPDELGVSLLGLSTIRLKKFLVISYFTHSIGMFTLLLISASLS